MASAERVKTRRHLYSYQRTKITCITRYSGTSHKWTHNYHAADKELQQYSNIKTGAAHEKCLVASVFVHTCFIFNFFIGICSITQPPQNVTVSENERAVFTCEFEDCEFIHWLVNDEHYANENCGMWSRPVYTPNDTSHELTLEEANRSCNESNVTCVTGIGEADVKASSSAILLIQG